MATWDLYIDVFNQALITGLGQTGGQAANLPQLFQGDNPAFRVYLCSPTFNPISPFTLMSIGGLSLQVAIGDKAGSGGTTYTSQLAWTPSVDPTQPNYFFAQLPLNTAAINTKLGTGGSFGAFFQVVYLQNGFQTTVLEIPCTVNASVIQNGGVVVPPGLTAISLEYANATFLARTIHGGFWMVDDNTNKKFFVYIGDDKQLHADEVA